MPGQDMAVGPSTASQDEATALQPEATPSTGPEATYSNVGLAAIPRTGLAVTSGVWAGAQLTSSCARPGPEARPLVAEYACVQKLKGTDGGPRGLEQGKVEATPAAQVNILYSRVSRPKRRDPGPSTDQPDPKGGEASLALGSDLAYEVLPLRGLGVDKSLLENVYASVQEMEAPGHLEPPSSNPYQERTCGPAVEFALPQEPEPRAADLGAPGAGAAGPPTPSAHIPREKPSQVPDTPGWLRRRGRALALPAGAQGPTCAWSPGSAGCCWLLAAPALSGLALGPQLLLHNPG
ncbi:PREDICTED: uncharacterized protein LOC103069302 [Lipotes vexillifer]|uniref:Uncharacterized protein LOC103069302 n=1 Tax=Lipotes vexillifer TaxID=118797 RepID=A0A340XQ63_LIPVE|nr:PREDICTED: uncharacterized protein LOC103069302 [Lipotes vexillifer]